MKYGQNIRIVEGNSFQLVCPFTKRVFVEGVPQDTILDATTFEQVVVKVNGVEWQSVVLDTRGVVVGFAADLEKNTYNIEITALCESVHIRGAWFEAFTIVSFNEQSNAEDYLAGSPLAGELPTAYILGGSFIDEVVQAIWEAAEYLQGEDAEATLTAIMQAVAPKATSAEVTAAKNAIIAAIPSIPNDYAKEVTAQAILNAVQALPSVQQIQAGLATEANATTNKQAILSAISALVIPSVEQIQNGLAKQALLQAVRDNELDFKWFAQAVGVLGLLQLAKWGVEGAFESEYAIASEEHVYKSGTMYVIARVYATQSNAGKNAADRYRAIKLTSTPGGYTWGQGSEVYAYDYSSGTIGNSIGTIENVSTYRIASFSDIDSAKQAILDAMPTGCAKQGSNADATNTAILSAINTLPDTMKALYSANFVQNSDGVDTYSMVLPVTAVVAAVEDGVSVTM